MGFNSLGLNSMEGILHRWVVAKHDGNAGPKTKQERAINASHRLIPDSVAHVVFLL